MNFISAWCSDTILCNFITTHIKPLSEFEGHKIFRVAQKEQLITKNQDGEIDGNTSVVHNGIKQGGLSPVWYTTEEGVQFYVNDEARQQHGYIIKAKMNCGNKEQGYFLNFAHKNGKLDFKAINSFINLTGFREKLNGLNLFNEETQTRTSHLYTDVEMFRYFIEKLDDLDFLADFDSCFCPQYPIYGFYLGKSDSNMTLYTENAFVYFPEYIIVQRYQKELLLIDGIDPLQIDDKLDNPCKRSREKTVSIDDIYLDISTSDPIPLSKKGRTSAKSTARKQPTTTKKTTKKRGGSKRKRKTRRKKRTYK